MRELLRAHEELQSLVLLNPRRAQFDVTDPTLTEKQIAWEFDHLHKADIIVFWFPKETLCPITLYELGAWSVRAAQTETKVLIGCHPEYQRRDDVIIQTRLSGLETSSVVDSLEALADNVARWVYE